MVVLIATHIDCMTRFCTTLWFLNAFLLDPNETKCLEHLKNCIDVCVSQCKFLIEASFLFFCIGKPKINIKLLNCSNRIASKIF